MPHRIAGSSNGDLVAHERCALLEDCLISLRVGLADEDMEIDWCVVEMSCCNGVGVLIGEYAAMPSHPLEDYPLYAGAVAEGHYPFEQLSPVTLTQRPE